MDDPREDARSPEFKSCVHSVTSGNNTRRLKQTLHEPISREWEMQGRT